MSVFDLSVKDAKLFLKLVGLRAGHGANCDTLVVWDNDHAMHVVLAIENDRVTSTAVEHVVREYEEVRK